MRNPAVHRIRHRPRIRASRATCLASGREDKVSACGVLAERAERHQLICESCPPGLPGRSLVKERKFAEPGLKVWKSFVGKRVHRTYNRQRIGFGWRLSKSAFVPARHRFGGKHTKTGLANQSNDDYALCSFLGNVCDGAVGGETHVRRRCNGRMNLWQ